MAHHTSDKPITINIDKQFEERLRDLQVRLPELGPTGRFPEGKIVEHDEGELQLAVTLFKGKVVMEFGKPIASLGFTPEQAKQVAYSLIERANEEIEKQPQGYTKPILCLDFDGVLHSYTSGWQGADMIVDPPVDGALEFVKEARDHFQIYVFSSRSNQRGGVEAMQKYLRKHGFPIYDMDFSREKPPAMVTIDDRALLFNGKFPSMEALKAFKSWNKEDRTC